MPVKRWLFLLALFALLVLAGADRIRAESPLGVKPDYSSRALTPIPNARALLASIWLPGLNDGFVPQGVVVLDDRLFVSAYRSTDRKQNNGPCRLYALDVRSGAVLGHLDLPEGCGHAGGLAKGMPGRLLLADTRALFEVELTNGLQPEIGRVVRTIKLVGGVKGSFAASGEDGFWLGQYERAGPAFMFRFPWMALAKRELSLSDAVETVSLPVFAQGAAFDSSGALWITRSGSKLGELVTLDRRNGAVLARFEMPAGIEGISFAADGTLWTLSEAGSQRWNHWAGFYPLAFRFDPKRLQ